MAIPDYQSIMLPLLRFAADDKEHSLREAIESLSREFDLTEDEKKGSLRSYPMKRKKLTAIISLRRKTASTPGRWTPDKKERKASPYLS
jgi:restriction endonuclease Mrr